MYSLQFLHCNKVKITHFILFCRFCYKIFMYSVHVMYNTTLYYLINLIHFYLNYLDILHKNNPTTKHFTVKTKHLFTLTALLCLLFTESNQKTKVYETF